MFATSGAWSVDALGVVMGCAAPATPASANCAANSQGARRATVRRACACIDVLLGRVVEV
ncbi:hypothetical protein ACE0DR_16060 [Azotobacter sp. CWF10]